MRPARRDAGPGPLPLLLLLLLLLAAAAPGTLGEIDVVIKIPIAVAENSTVKMTCDYDLHAMPLYSVKWYKSQHEFYRYIPKELPSKSVFPPLAGKVDFNQSDEHNVILNNVEPNLAGKYRCEVSTDAPTFITRMESSYMHVVRLPKGNLTLRTEKPRYALGETVRGNCTAPPANPPANITWLVNGVRINSSSLRNMPTGNINDNRTITIAGIEFDLSSDNFSNTKLRITCLANVFQLYKEEATVVLDGEHPRLAPILGTPSLSRTTDLNRMDRWILAFTIANILLASTR